MDAMAGESRFPDGFVLTDVQHGYAWVYDWIEDGGFFAARSRDTLDEVKLDKARKEPKYDIRAYDPEVMS
jgi:hypothetical protein